MTMRPVLFVIGLAFVATMLISNVNAIRCYDPRGDKVDCDTFPGSITKCVEGTVVHSENGGQFQFTRYVTHVAI